jgi:hypothetical protein
MAIWQSLFDLGECTVRVVVNDVQAFNQVMQKGQTAQFQRNSATYTIAVGATDGKVTLSNDQDSSPFNDFEHKVYVIPTYANSGYGDRIITASFNADAASASGVVNTDDDGVAYSTLSPADPDPMALSDVVGQHVLVGIVVAPAP